MYVTWSDRQNVIRTGGFDVLDDLPHFLLILIIIQRFDLARWDFFTEFEGSSIEPIRGGHITYALKVTRTDGTAITIFPNDDPVYVGVNLAGRSTSIAGAREDNGQIQNPTSSREANNLVAKFSWPEETRENEVVLIDMATDIGSTNDLVKDHLPTVIYHIDPPHLTCSTRIIRTFLCLDTAGARVLRVIVFTRLKEIKYLDEKNMLIAFFDTFFCEFFFSIIPQNLSSRRSLGPVGERDRTR
jgi:hypothetical protein